MMQQSAPQMMAPQPPIEAHLPTGEVLHFAPGTHPTKIHTIVRSRMGLPPPEVPPDPMAIAQEHITTAIMAVQQSSQAMSTQLAHLAQEMSGALSALQASAEAIAVSSHRLTTAVAAAGQRVGEAMLHTSQQTVGATETASVRAAEAHARVEKAVGQLAAEVQDSTQKVTSALKAPRKARKTKDGDWVSEV